MLRWARQRKVDCNAQRGHFHRGKHLTSLSLWLCPEVIQDHLDLHSSLRTIKEKGGGVIFLALRLPPSGIVANNTHPPIFFFIFYPDGGNLSARKKMSPFFVDPKGVGDSRWSWIIPRQSQKEKKEAACLCCVSSLPKGGGEPTIKFMMVNPCVCVFLDTYIQGKINFRRSGSASFFRLIVEKIFFLVHDSFT